ncbi:FAD-dependent oxidoreductase [Peptoniphilus catoniae]|uniref:FAD-dependent oxidoreductase n=1 Tax=Peptoniphilus catoniae TaxID=1660341 RepID=UPI0010FE00CE|nr:FAD-dependent oxidoreductase [Peptoniphilus catoniae]
MKKFVIVGGVAGGASVAARLRRLNEDARIIVLEKGPYPSFSNCSLPYYLGEIVEKEELFITSPQVLKDRFNIEVRVNNEVVSINPEDKTIDVRGESGLYKESYDELILSPGSLAIRPDTIKGSNMDHVFTIKEVKDVVELDLYLRKNKVKNVAIVGGGFIGLEVMENLKSRGLNISLIEMENQVLAPLDYDMVQIIHKTINDKGIDLILEDKVEEVTKDSIKLSSGRKLLAELVVFALGVPANTILAEKTGIKIGEEGGILVNQHYETNVAHIYAIGDAIETYNQITYKATRLGLAGPTQKQARSLADYLSGIYNENRGVIGSGAVKVFDFNIAFTGLNEKEAKKEKIQYETALVMENDILGTMPNSETVFLKLIFENKSGRILGAQAISKGESVKRIDVISTLIQMNGKVDDLKDLELAYAPPYGTARDVANVAGMVASNLLHGSYKQKRAYELRDLVKKGEYILDVRSRKEYQLSHIKGSVNIPLEELRQRLEELPKDRSIYVHCRTSKRSYNATKILLSHGFDVYNIQGSILFLSYYEYFNNKRKNRDSIFTDYNFN